MQHPPLDLWCCGWFCGFVAAALLFMVSRTFGRRGEGEDDD